MVPDLKKLTIQLKRWDAFTKEGNKKTGNKANIKKITSRAEAKKSVFQYRTNLSGSVIILTCYHCTHQHLFPPNASIGCQINPMTSWLWNSYQKLLWLFRGSSWHFLEQPCIRSSQDSAKTHPWLPISIHSFVFTSLQCAHINVPHSLLSPGKIFGKDRPDLPNAASLKLDHSHRCSPSRNSPSIWPEISSNI